MELFNLWAIYLFLGFASLIFLRYVSIEDPIIRALIWPLAGITYLLVGTDTFVYDADYYIFLFLIIIPILFLNISTPNYLNKKTINKFTIKLFTIFSVIAIISNALDIFYNFDFSISVFNPAVQTFDLRGNLGNSGVKLISMGVNFACMPSLALANNFKIKNLKIFTFIWLITSLVAGFNAPGKSFLILPFFYILDYLFWKKVFCITGYKVRKLIDFKKLIISKTKLISLSITLLIGVILLIVSLFFINIFLDLDKDSFAFLTNRVFAASYPLSFEVLRKTSISADFNYPPTEFSNIIELWLKFIFKNIFGKLYINDTIPKYVLDFLYGFGGEGKSSMNSNLMVETTILHGRYLGSFLSILICFGGAIIRRIMLRQEQINIFTFLLLPIIAEGPFFCFQAGQSFWAYYIPFISIVIFLYFFFKFGEQASN